MNKCLKKIIILMMNIILLIFSSNIAYAQEFGVGAKAYALLDLDTGNFILEKNYEKVLPPASTTKIMTGIIGIEQGCLNDLVNVSLEAAKVGESSIYLKTGDIINLKDLLKGALIKSGNDATVAIGEHICGDLQIFILLMNRKAKILGAKNTNFMNPNGLPQKNHYTTAKDLALMARYSMHNNYFREIVNIKEDKIQLYSNNIKKETRYLKNINKLLWSYSGANGIKTGTTREAGACLVASATRNKKTFISVVLNSNNRYGDTIKLLNYGFNN